MYRPVLIKAPAEAPVSVSEAKAHCRVDVTDENNLLQALIAAAVTHLDGWSGILGRCLVRQTWRQDFDGFAWCLRLPLAPAIEVTSVTYKDTAGAEQTVAAPSYQLLADERGPFVRFASTFSAPSLQTDRPAVSVTYAAGYGGPDDVPQAIKHAMLLLIGHWYENREAVVAGSMSAAPMAVDALLTPFRRLGC